MYLAHAICEKVPRPENCTVANKYELTNASAHASVLCENI